MLRPVILSDLKNYSLKLFRADLFSGLTVGVVAIPMAMAFAIACSTGEHIVKPQVGLITAIVAGIIIALSGGSRTQVSGPTGAFIVIISGVIAAHGFTGLVTATFLAGIILILMAIFKMGAFLKYIPYPVIVGFTTAIAIIIFSTQIKDIFGLEIPGGLPANFIEKCQCYAKNFGSVNFYALGLSLLTIAVIFAMRRWAPKLPAMLIGMLASTAIYLLLITLTGNDKLVLTIEQAFGELPRTLPLPSLPSIPWEALSDLFMPAFTIAILCAIESLLSASVADGMTGDRHKPNAELLGQGIGNVACAFFGGLPATGAIARTATNIRAGGKTPISAIIHALTIMIIMLLFAPYAGKIPLAALAGVLVVVCWNMSEIRTFTAMFKGPRSDAFVMLITFGATILSDLVVAVGIGIVLSAFLFIRRMSEISDISALKIGDTDENIELADTDPTVNYKLDHSIEVFELHGPFFFGAVDSFKDTILSVFNHRVRVVILRMRDVPALDATGLNALQGFHQQCARKHIQLIISGIQDQPLNVLEKSGFADKMGRTNICRTFKVAAEYATLCVNQSRADDPLMTRQG